MSVYYGSGTICCGVRHSHSHSPAVPLPLSGTQWTEPGEERLRQIIREELSRVIDIVNRMPRSPNP